MTRPPARAPARQRGVVLVAIMAVLFMTLMIASALINHYVVGEAEAVERDLAETRARWAQVGYLDYTLSRAMAAGEGLVGVLSQVTLLSNLTGYLGTLADSANLIRYEDGSGAYVLNVTGFAEDLDVAVLDGRVRLTLSVDQPSGTIPAVQGLHLRVPALYVDACIGDVDVESRTPDATCVSLLGLGDSGIASILAMRTL